MTKDASKETVQTPLKFGKFAPVTALDIPPWVKANFFGDGGTGKSHAAATVAIGLAKHMKEVTGDETPVLWLDTEDARGFLVGLFDEAGITCYAQQTRKFSDLLDSLALASEAGAILIIDSITHFWEGLSQAYLQAKRERLGREDVTLTIDDWRPIKERWRTFITALIDAECHVVMTGRSASVYDSFTTEEGERKDIKDGTRAAAEKGFTHEPNIVIEFDIKQADTPTGKSVSYIASILKDRTRRINGRVFTNMTYADFLPHVEFLQIGRRRNAAGKYTAEAKDTDIFPTRRASDVKRVRETILGEIDHLFSLHIPGMAAADKQLRARVIQSFFGGPREVIETMDVGEAGTRLDNMRRWCREKFLQGKDIEPEAVIGFDASISEALDDEIPFTDAVDAPQRPQPQPQSQPQPGDEAPWPIKQKRQSLTQKPSPKESLKAKTPTAHQPLKDGSPKAASSGTGVLTAREVLKKKRRVH